jgi:hypothetical protein
MWRSWTARKREEIQALSTEQELREKLRKILALFKGTTSAGEREAAEAAGQGTRSAGRRLQD